MYHSRVFVLDVDARQRDDETIEEAATRLAATLTASKLLQIRDDLDTWRVMLEAELQRRQGPEAESGLSETRRAQLREMGRQFTLDVQRTFDAQMSEMIRGGKP
jgi:hypothetical protein